MKELERQAETLGLDTRKGNREPQKGPSGRALSQVAILSLERWSYWGKTRGEKARKMQDGSPAGKQWRLYWGNTAVRNSPTLRITESEIVQRAAYVLGPPSSIHCKTWVLEKVVTCSPSLTVESLGLRTGIEILVFWTPSSLQSISQSPQVN